jgi:tetratricopeptide (TPR) repeat protein
LAGRATVRKPMISLGVRKAAADNCGMRLWIVSLIIALIALAGPSAFADQKDPRLDKLFTQLKSVTSAEEAQPIEAQIWEIWMQSGDENVDALMAIGVSALNGSDYGQALKAFDRVVNLAPNFAEGWNRRATTLYLMGRFAESIKDIDRVLALEPRHFGALSGLGLCNAQLNKDKEALDAFERAATVDPNMPSVNTNIEELKKKLAKQSI